MRIIAGRFRSRRLKTLPGARTRPTSDRLRETLFNVLGESVAGAVFADCYAGSGAVGLEALSRGARLCFFLEKLRPAVRVIKSNLASLKIEGGFEIIARDVSAGLGELARRGVKLDLVFLDPPYRAAEEYERTLALLGEAALLAADARVIVEHARQTELRHAYGALQRSRKLAQGDSALSFFAVDG